MPIDFSILENEHYPLRPMILTPNNSCPYDIKKDDRSVHSSFILNYKK